MKRLIISTLVAGVVALGILLFLPKPSRPVSAPPAAASAGAIAPAPLVAASPKPAAADLTMNPPPSPSPSRATAPTPAPAENPLKAIDAFAHWAEQFTAGDPSANLAQGEAMAWQRREAMRALIQSDPERALALAAPYRWRQELPARITRYFEQRVDGRGDFKVAAGTDFDQQKVTIYRSAEINGTKYDAFVYGRRLAQPSRSRIPIHLIAIDRQAAVSSEPLRELEPAEAAALDEASPSVEKICGVSGKPAASRNSPVAAEAGGEVLHFCGSDHLALVNKQWSLAESGREAHASYGSFADDSWTHGPKTTLYIRVNFPDDLTEPISETGAYAVMDGVNEFFTENSYNLTSFTTTVTPLVTLPQTKAYYSTAGPGALQDDARAAAFQAGYDTSNFDRDIIALTSVPGDPFKWCGLAYVGAKGVWLQCTSVGVTAHELGHNFGLFHANAWLTTPESQSATAAGTNSEYGNIYDTMGSGLGSQYNAIHKNILDWISDSMVQEITSNGVYRIYPFDATNRVDSRFYAAKVRKDFLRDYWLEFRQKINNPWLRNGVTLNWAPWQESNGGTSLIDTTPGPLNGAGDAAVVVGRTFSDVANGVHITPLQRGATGLDPWIEVQVNLGFFPGNQPPELGVEVDKPAVAAGQVVHFHATTSDPDGDALAYAWSFDDQTFSTNNQPWTSRSWSLAGDHVVHCVVSDMKGGRASANVLVTVGAKAGFRVSGRVTDTNGVPMENVRVDNGAFSSDQYFGGYTDSDGRYLISGVNTDLVLNAFFHGYTFTNVAWTNPVSATVDVANIDFVAYPMQSVFLTASTNSIAENNAAAQYFRLTRTGDTNQDLVVRLYLSGSATLGSDYTLDPPFSQGFATIPAGTNTLDFVFHALNDSTVEGPETVTLTLVDDDLNPAAPNYVILPQAEATITILDDDVGSLPQVTLTTTTPSIPENGTASGQLLFTRTGSTLNDLFVHYSVSGSAIAGSDYTTLAGVALIPAGQSSVAIPVRPVDDKKVEPDETVVATITANAAYAVGAPSSAQVKILDDDQMVVTIVPTGANAVEPSTPGHFTVKRDGDLSEALTVFYNVGGTATSGSDYVPFSGSVTIAAGATSADVTLFPLDDVLLEGDESVTLSLTNNVNYDVGVPGSATLFIRDNELPTVTVSVSDNTAAEPGSDTGTFVITRSGGTAGSLTVFLSISGSAIPGSDYVPLDNPVTIPSGASSVTMDVIVFDDLHFEPTEDVIIMAATNAGYNVLSGNFARVTIDDDDSAVPAVGFSFSTSTVIESQTPLIAVELSAPTLQPVTVDYRVIGGTAPAGRYSLAPGPLTFLPADRVKFIRLQINNDSLVEPNQTIRIALFDPTNATLDGIKIHTCTIVDDDTNSVSISATAPDAFETGLLPGNFRIARTGPTTSPLVVNFEVTGTGSAPTDYAPIGTSVTIPTGAAFVDLPVIPTDDPTTEPNQTVVVTLISAPLAKIVSPSRATVTIWSNDTNALPVVSVTSSNQPNAVENGGNGEFIFTRTGPTTNSLLVSFTVGGSATSGADYTAIGTSVTIPIGQSSVVVPVAPINDALVEGDESVIVTLVERDTYQTIYPSSATVTIQDDDQMVWIDASDFFASEPGTDPGEFTFSRFGTTNAAVQIFFTIGGTAGNGVDYVAISNSFVIPAGSLTAKLPITAIDDLLVEGPETITLTLQTNAAYTLGAPSSATMTLMDDEPMVTITAAVATVLEGSQSNGIFRLTRFGDPKYDFTARLAIGGTATYGVDYPPFLTNVYFSCGITSIDLFVSPYNEAVTEPNETVTAALVPDPAYSILAPSNAVITILDAGPNATPMVTITKPAPKTIFLTRTNQGLVLEATVVDDSPSNTLAWTETSGPDTFRFDTTNTANSAVLFTGIGIYVLRLTADDGQWQGYDEITVVVGAPEIIPDPALYWPFDEGSGLTAHDASGQGHDGVLVGAPAWTNGASGQALRFGGANDLVRQAAGSNVLNGGNAFTLSLYVNAQATNLDLGIFTASSNAVPGTPTVSLAARSLASCGNSLNVFEATVATTKGSVRRVTATSSAKTNQWQHLALTWAKGQSASVYLDGELDQPNTRWASLGGALTNCPDFIVGKGPVDSPNLWKGLIDDVVLIPRLLSPGEILCLGGGPTGGGLPGRNHAPIVDAGTNLTIQTGIPFDLAGVVTDDGLPNPPAATSNYWSQIIDTNGVNTNVVIIPDPSNLTNTLVFTDPGDYVFRLTANDGEIETFAEITVTVVLPTRIDLFASDGDASELGPDPGEFTIMRDQTETPMTVYLALSGTASNGMDFVTITNVVTFPVDTNSLTIPVLPFLDNRIEGDETLVLTVVSNVAYTIGSGEATVMIHDSPYGVWSIQQFTLEELTFPLLTGPRADFDHDGVRNFVEYALNLDPRMPETNPAPAWSFETSTNDNRSHLTITYHRRLPPTDVAYGVVAGTNLLDLNGGSNYVEEFFRTNDPNGVTETVKTRVIAPVSASSRQFITVRVWFEQVPLPP